MTQKFNFSCVLIILCSTVWFASDSFSSDAPLELQTLKTHSRLVFRVDSGTQPKWTDVPGGFELYLGGAQLADLGAPLGTEREWIAEKKKAIQDERLQAIDFVETQTGLKVKGKWNFAKGDQAPANAKMEHFDYQEKNPARVVIDFWQKTGPTISEMRAIERKREIEVAMKKDEEESAKRKDLRLAREHARAEEQDVGKYCREPLTESNSVFLPFYPNHEKFQFSKYLPKVTADESYVYPAPSSVSEKEAQVVRLALRLYADGKYALVLRTIEFLNKDYPRSRYNDEARFLKANTYLKLGFDKEANNLFKVLISESRGTLPAFQAAAFMALKQLEGDSPLAALETFLWMVQNYPDHKLRWLFHMGAAESLYALKQTEKAVREYFKVIEYASDTRTRADAALRMGDLYLLHRQYERALATYFQASNKYPKEAQEFPTIRLNKAESFYWLGQWEKAKDTYISFLSQFPSHASGWRATYRLAEIFARQSGQSADSQARKYFLETANRYPLSPGATLARVRLLPCGDHAGFNGQSADRFFGTDAKSFVGEGEIDLAEYPSLRAVSHLRTLMAFGMDERVVEEAVDQYRVYLSDVKNSTREKVAHILKLALRKRVSEFLDKGEMYSAIASYSEQMQRIDSPLKWKAEESDFLLRLAKASSDLGLGSYAQRLNEEYQRAHREVDTGRELATGDTKAKVIKIESNEDISDRLVTSERNFSTAKAQWVLNGAESEVIIRESLSQVIDESPYSYEREILLGLLDQKASKKSSALTHALKAQLLGGVGAKDQARLKFWIAGLHAQAGDSRAAVELYRDLQKRKPSDADGRAAVDLPEVPGAAELLVAEAEILTQQGRWGEVAEAYERGVSAKMGGNRFLYEFARALKKTGEANKAENILKRLATSEVNDFWKKLAQETLAKSQNNNNAKEGNL